MSKALKIYVWKPKITKSISTSAKGTLKRFVRSSTQLQQPSHPKEVMLTSSSRARLERQISQDQGHQECSASCTLIPHQVWPKQRSENKCLSIQSKRCNKRMEWATSKVVKRIAPRPFYNTSCVDGKIAKRKPSFWLTRFLGIGFWKLGIAISRQVLKVRLITWYICSFITNFDINARENNFLKIDILSWGFSYA